MVENPIIAEIHRHREELSRRFDDDLEKLIEYYKSRDQEWEAAGHPLVVLSATGAESSLVREEPPQT